jgi:hypothetical protein
MSVAQLSRMSKGTLYLNADDGAGLVSARYWFTDKVLRTQLDSAKQWLIDHESRLNEAQIDEMQQDIEQEMQAHE